MLPQKLSDQWKERASRGGECARTEEKQTGSRFNHTANLSPAHHTYCWGFFFLGGGDTDSAQSAVMLHPLIIGIVTVNTSLTIIYWTFLLGDAYFKWLMETEDKPKKVVTPA